MSQNETASLRWGLVGPGGIAERFAAALERSDGGELHAVASRDLARAERFASEHGAPVAVGGHSELFARSDVDVVYVAVPHSYHCELVIEALGAGKHVLCEKPMGISGAEVRSMVAAANAAGRFLMEGMWSRFLPAYRTITELVASGRIGRPLLVDGSFGFRAPFDPAHRWFDPALAGGALLDLGVYPLHLAEHVLGHTEQVHAVAALGATGVDEVTTVLTSHPNGAAAVTTASLSVDLDWTASIRGTGGRIVVEAPLHDPPGLRVVDAEGEQRLDCSYEGDGLRFELDEVHRSISAGLVESPSMTLADSVRFADVLESARRAIGVTYPSETGSPELP